MRAPLNIDEFSAIAFIRSSLPTMSTMNACRAGMSNAFTTPSNAASTKMCQTWIRVCECQRSQHKRQDHGGYLGRDHHAMTVVAVGNGSADGRQQKHGDLRRESDRAEQNGRTCQAVDQPGLRDTLHPGPDEGNELAAEKQPKIAVP